MALYNRMEPIAFSFCLPSTTALTLPLLLSIGEQIGQFLASAQFEVLRVLEFRRLFIFGTVLGRLVQPLLVIALSLALPDEVVLVRLLHVPLDLVQLEPVPVVRSQKFVGYKVRNLLDVAVLGRQWIGEFGWFVLKMRSREPSPITTNSRV